MMLKEPTVFKYLHSNKVVFTVKLRNGAYLCKNGAGSGMDIHLL